jgi:hypothetical protein
MMESTCLDQPVTLVLQCINKFPQDLISEEKRGVVLMVNATGCSFSSMNLLDRSKDASCSRGEGYYHVYNGTDKLTDKLLVQGAQDQEGSSVSFKACSTVPLNMFSISFEPIGTLEVKLKCVNVLKNNDTIKSAGNRTLFFEVHDRSLCKLSFSHVHHVKSFKIVHVGNISDEVGNNHITFYAEEQILVTTVSFSCHITALMMHWFQYQCLLIRMNASMASLVIILH